MFMVPPGLTAGKDIVETILSSGPGSGCSRQSDPASVGAGMVYVVLSVLLVAVGGVGLIGWA